MSPDTRRDPSGARGAHPEDRKLFGPAWLPVLRAGAAELSWLLERGYPPKAALKLVGDRHGLRERQRTAVARAACPETRARLRRERRLEPGSLRGRDLVVDGLNLLITLEAALSGGALLRCRDGCLRDMASLHGSYRSVEETAAAIRLAGEELAALEPASVLWLLDRPVSNSGRLAARLREAAAGEGWPWTVETPFNPDRALIASGGVAVTSDSVVLDGAARWADLASPLVAARVPDAWIVDLREEAGSGAEA